MSFHSQQQAIAIKGIGAVSPAGWTAHELSACVEKGERLPHEKILREGCDRPARVLHVPDPESPQKFARHPRLRRASPVSRFLAAAGLEALGEERATAVQEGTLKLGIIVTFATGCVNYTRRYYEELLEDPSLASPILFPETVFNAPASHLAAILGSTGINYTLLGDGAEYLSGLRLACDWLTSHQCDGCLIIGAEEIDWLISEAVELFTSQAILAEGAGALYLERDENRASDQVYISQLTEPVFYTNEIDRSEAPRQTRDLLNLESIDESETALVDSLQGIPRLDVAESLAWKEWNGPSISPRTILGDSPGTAAAWQCVYAASLLTRDKPICTSALVSAVGMNQKCLAARFSRSPVAE